MPITLYARTLLQYISYAPDVASSVPLHEVRPRAHAARATGACRRRPRRRETGQAWSAAEGVGVLLFRSKGILRHRVSRTQLSGCPLPCSGRVVEWLGPLSGVWKVVDSTPLEDAFVFSTR